MDEIRRLAEARDLRCTTGGRFHHLQGATDKGCACRRLIDAYRRHFVADARPLVTVGLGDSLNDLPILTAVDRPILVQKPDGTYDPNIDLPHLIRAPGIGPVGWNRAVLHLLVNHT